MVLMYSRKKIISSIIHMYVLIHRMMASSATLKVSEERVKMYIQKKNQYLSVSVCDGEQELDADPYDFVEEDEEFSFTDKEKRPGAEPAKRNKVSHVTL